MSELPAGHRIANYTLQRRLGSGSHGTVYLARDARTKGWVALKLLPLPPGEAGQLGGQAFLDAAKAARLLHHPDVVAVFGAGLDGNTAWLAMEAVPGADLARYTRPPRLLPESLVLRLGQRLAAALAHAHQQGVVHRDVKPANVLVHWPSDTVKLADFGLSRMADASNTATGMMLGSPAYMAPEQLAGVVPTARTDLYALGITLYELLTGRPAFDGNTMGELLRQITQLPAPNLAQSRPDLPAALALLLQRLMARDVTARPNDAKGVADELAALAGQMGTKPA